MENLLLFLATSLVMRRPSPRKLKSHSIGNTGCTALLQEGSRARAHLTEDGDRLYLQEFKEGAMSYGIICIHLSECYALDAAEQMLSTYLDRLRESFRIEHQVGVRTTEDWNTNRSRSVVDYWQDHGRSDWKVKGYTNGTVLSVLYVKNIGQGDTGCHDHFLDSFHFGVAV